MSTTDFDLISMADIARLAGQSRATVGNWKGRNLDDFPPERGRGSRGPLYDRTEVTEWLIATNRLDERPPEVAAVWELANDLRDGITTEDAMQLGLVLLAVMATSPADWKKIRDARESGVDTTIRSVVASLFPYAGELLPRGLLPHAAVERAVATLSMTDPGTVARMTDALLEQAAQTLGYRGGEYLSPASVRRLVVALAEPSGAVYNPASGVGQLMVDAARNDPAVTSVVGQEINQRVWAMAQLNLAIHGIQADVALGDVFMGDAFPDLRADRVIAVPPWGQKLVALEQLRGDARWLFGEPGPNDGNAAWIQHCLYHLADGGRAVVVLPNGVLFESGRAGRMRQRIVKAGLLDAVIALPAGLFPSTGIPCSILIFVRGRPTVHGKPAPTLMIDISDASESHGPRLARLSTDVINDVARTYREWTAGNHPTDGNAAIATFDEIVINDFVIGPARYLALPEPALPLDDAISHRNALAADLDRLLDASKQADNHLESLLGRRS
jgi:type I restriction-modification system DNA methylase subunit